VIIANAFETAVTDMEKGGQHVCIMAGEFAKFDEQFIAKIPLICSLLTSDADTSGKAASFCYALLCTTPQFLRFFTNLDSKLASLLPRSQLSSKAVRSSETGSGLESRMQIIAMCPDPEYERLLALAAKPAGSPKVTVSALEAALSPVKGKGKAKATAAAVAATEVAEEEEDKEAAAEEPVEEDHGVGGNVSIFALTVVATMVLVAISQTNTLVRPRGPAQVYHNECTVSYRDALTATSIKLGDLFIKQVLYRLADHVFSWYIIISVLLVARKLIVDHPTLGTALAPIKSSDAGAVSQVIDLVRSQYGSRAAFLQACEI
jgi:hypothetical protein